MTEERRTVVVMFAQVAGLAELPDVERAEFTDAVFLRLRKIIEARGGRVDKFIGDVVMALWGAPVAHEDDAARATRAAGEMAAETERLGAEAGKELSLRAGLNLGEVLFGSVGGDRATAMGDPVNVAQRLMSGAEPGIILLSRAASDAVGGAVTLRRRPPMELRGRAEPVEVFEAAPDLGPRTTLRARPDLAAPLCGRSAEVESLVARLASAAEGTPACVALCGEPGVGKSRLAAEVRRRLRAGTPAFRAWVGHSPEDAKVPLMAPGEILREALSARGVHDAQPSDLAQRLRAALEGEVPREAERRSLAALIVESLGLESGEGAAASLDPARVEAETWRAWTLALGSLARDQPAIFIFEDVQFADPSTRGLLSRLPALLAGRRVALLATSRADADAPEGWVLHAVGGISRESLGEVASRILGAPLAPALADFISEKAEGNPLFAQELARYLRENNLASGNPCTLLVPPSRLPDRLTSLLTARLDGLPPVARETVKAAAVLGREFGAEMLKRVLRRETADPLHAAASRRIVERTGARSLTGEDEWSFQHALVRDAAYQLLTKRERRSLHDLAAVDLEPLAGSDPRRIGPVAARHRENAGQPELAARHWNAAARSALRHHAWLECASDAQEAVRLGLAEGRLAAAEALIFMGRMQDGMAECEALLADASASPGLRAAAHLSLAKAYNRMGNPDLSIAAAEESARLDPGPRNRVEALLWQGSSLGKLARSREALERLQVAATLAEPTFELLREIGNCHSSLGQYDEAERAIRAGLSAAEAIKDTWAEGISANSLGLVRIRAGKPREALPWFERARDAFRDSADRAGLATALANIGLALQRSGRRPEAEAPILEALDIRQQIGDLAGIASCKGMLADSASYRRDYETAERLESEVVEMARTLRNASLEASGTVHIGNTHFLRGFWTRALECYERAYGIASAVKDPLSVAACASNIGMVCLQLGKGARALPFLEESMTQRVALGHRSSAQELTIHIAEARRLCGETRSALQALEPFLSSLPPLNRARCAAARILSAAGRHAEAAGYASAAVAEYGAKDGDEELEGLMDLAFCFVRSGERRQANEFLRKALDGSEALGGAGVAMQARLELAGLALKDGNAADARPPASETLRRARNAGDRNLERRSLLLLARCEARDGNLPEACRRVGEARALPDILEEDLEPRIEGLVALALAAAEVGDLGEARSLGNDVRGTATKAGLPGLLWELEGMPWASASR